MTKALESDTDPKAKNDPERTLNNIKSRLELEQRIAVQCSAHPEEIEENKSQVKSVKLGKTLDLNL